MIPASEGHVKLRACPPASDDSASSDRANDDSTSGVDPGSRDDVPASDVPASDVPCLSDAAVARCREIGAEFLGAMTRVCASSRTDHVAFLPLVVTTVTFTGKYFMPVAELDIDALRGAIEVDPFFADQLGLRLTPPATGKRKRDDVFVRDVAHDRRRFLNQITMALGGTSVKLFYNGSLHVTGCASALAMADVASRMASLVAAYTDFAVNITLESMNVRMINAGTVAVRPTAGSGAGRPMTFPPRALSQSLASLGVDVDFDAERHPGVKLPIRVDGVRVATACIFQTGSVSIIGARDAASMAAAFEAAAMALNACIGLGTPVAAPRKTTGRKPFSLVDGYPANSYWACC